MTLVELLEGHSCTLSVCLYIVAYIAIPNYRNVVDWCIQLEVLCVNKYSSACFKLLDVQSPFQHHSFTPFVHEHYK